MPKLPIVLKDKIYLPEKAVDTYSIEDRFTHSLFKDSSCAKCEYRDDRPEIPEEGDICYSCDSYGGTYKLYSYTRIKGENYVGLPIGARQIVSKYIDFKNYEVVDERYKPPFKTKGIKFTGELYKGFVEDGVEYNDQVKPCEDMIKYQYGVLSAPPRTGKTVMGTYIACKLGMKTLILASQIDWLEQFYETIMGDAGLNAVTNIPELEEKYGRKICGIAKTEDDFKNFDIALCFPANTDVLIDYNKSMTIKNIYESKHIKEVLSYDLKKKEIVRKEIVRKYRRKVNENLYEVTVTSKDGRPLPITCTENHTFHTVNRGDVAAKDLLPLDKLITYDGDFTRSFVCTCGEICASRAEFSGHTRMCKKHNKYIAYNCPTCNKYLDSMQKEFSHTNWCNKTLKQRRVSTTHLRTPKVRKKIIASNKIYWSSLSIEEKRERVKHLWGRTSCTPTKAEIKIKNWRFKGLKYTGCTRSYRINLSQISKNPDFVYPNKVNPTKVIEVMDFNYWHSKDEIPWLKRQYKAKGIECLVLDADLVSINPEKARAKIEAFLNNHNTSVVSVRKLQKKSNVYVYNIEVKDTHKYFVVATSGNKVNHSNDASLSKLSTNATPILVNNCTYQTFLHKPELLAKVVKMFGLLLIDEAHGTGADEFSKVVNKFECHSRMGLTATPDRKDSKEFLLYSIVGPVKTKAVVKQLKPKVVFIPTGYSSNYKVWNYMLKGLAKDEDRNNLIADLVIKAVKKGHSVVIPVQLKEHMNLLVDLINKKAGKNIALPFHGGLRKDVRRNTILEARLAKKCKVIVGIRSLVQTGINIPVWSLLLEVSPISNTPKLKQESSRILTYMPGKIQPVILQLVDDANIPKACLRKCVSDYKQFGYTITKKQWDIIKPYMTRARSHEVFEEEQVTSTNYKPFVKRML